MGKRKKDQLPVAPVLFVCFVLIVALSLGIAMCCKVIWGDGEQPTKKPSDQTTTKHEVTTSGENEEKTTKKEETSTTKKDEGSSQHEQQTGEEQPTKFSSVGSDGVTPMFVPDSVEKIEAALADDFLRLLNKENHLGESYVPDTLEEIDSGVEADGRIADACRAFIAGARDAGFTDLYACSGYRTYEWQYNHYYDSIEKYVSQGYSREEAERLTGRDYMFPGASEHQYGMCMDIVTYSYVGQAGLTDGFDQTDCWKWINENDYKYGFILRYAEDKEDITGIMYEPWHYRYVGVEHATFMKEHDMCLEEYIDFLKEQLEILKKQ